MQSKIAVLISDIHFSLKTLSIAAVSLTEALRRAEELNVPLILAGDTHDTKAILRGECIKVIIDIIKSAKVPVKVLIGNHDRWHEKEPRHSLEFLRPYVDLIDSTRIIDEHFGNTVGFIPYQNSNEAFLQELNQFIPGQIIVCHQGFMGAAMGEYIKDDSSVDPKAVAKFRIVSGHYHMHQTIGTITYIGTPYTITFAEANDGHKGFVIMNSDGSLTKVPLDLRRHVIIERTLETLYDKILEPLNKDDIIWLKVSGSSIELDKLNKKQVGKKLFGHESFKFDTIPTDTDVVSIDMTNLSDEEIIDSIIDQDSEATTESKQYRKDLWREILK